jgi:CHAD domain-containing protein
VHDDAPAAAEILARSPEEGARRLALGCLEQAAAILPRLAGKDEAAGADPEALHDMRVALRRLRSCLRAYRGPLAGSLSQGAAKRLRRLARATGPGRDTEVQIEWLKLQAAALGRHHRAGLSWLLARLAARLETAYGDLRDELTQGFPPLAAQLREQLSVYRTEVRLDGGRPPSFGDAAARLLLDHAADLERRLARIDGAGDETQAHEARISAKRLRYLAEPLGQLVQAAAPAPAGPLVPRLKELQDLLGELHDAHRMEAELTTALAEAAAQRTERLLELTLAAGDPDPHRLRQERRRPQEPGLLALARLNRDRRDRLFADFAARWQGGDATRLARQAKALAAALRAAGGEAAGTGGSGPH